MIVSTSIGYMEYRDETDLRVIDEVITQDMYRRWGDIQIKPGDLVIDAGAHIGAFSKLAFSCGAEVIAVEPNPDNFRLLQKNVGCLKLNVALANTPTVFMDFSSNRSDLYKTGDTGIEVDALTLDEVIGNNQIDLLKMDVEGAEYDILNECHKLDQVKQITMEYHNGLGKLGWLCDFLDDHWFEFGWIGGQDFGHLQVKRVKR